MPAGRCATASIDASCSAPAVSARRLTSRQTELVQRTFAQLLAARGAFAQAFFVRLFQLDPGLQAVFAPTVDGAELWCAFDGLVNGAAARPGSLGPRHRAGRLRRYDVDTLARAFCDCSRTRLGAGFDSEHEQAWHAAFGCLAMHADPAAEDERSREVAGRS